MAVASFNFPDAVGVPNKAHAGLAISPHLVWPLANARDRAEWKVGLKAMRIGEFESLMKGLMFCLQGDEVEKVLTSEFRAVFTGMVSDEPGKRGRLSY